MPVEWRFADDVIRLGGARANTIDPEQGKRQQETARAILSSLRNQPGVILADEVGMGKTYVALAVVASVLLASGAAAGPVVVMMPRGLASKWPREWEQFKSLCTLDRQRVAKIRDRFVRTPTEFFKALDETPSRRPHLIWMTTGCLSKGLNDPWVKLALIRLGRSETKMSDEIKKRLNKWTSTLTRLKSYRRFTVDLVDRLMRVDINRWREILVREEVLPEDAPDPVPRHLIQNSHRLDWSELNGVIRGKSIPGRKGNVSDQRLRDARSDFNQACKNVYEQWLMLANWRAPLLVLDEAHHAKNDHTRLASLLRSEDTERLIEHRDRIEDRPLLWDKFDRMLFLTATPFQLGHQEVIRVLRSFEGAKWTGESAPAFSRETFRADMAALEDRLDTNRLAGRRLDRLWGRLDGDRLTAARAQADDAAIGGDWWSCFARDATEPFDRELIGAVGDCRTTKTRAETDPERRWASLRTWIIRHNRPRLLPSLPGMPDQARREHRHGASILDDAATHEPNPGGLPISASAVGPFLLAARAQGELAAGTGKTRAYFVEGLCSSYEAFHHTRMVRGDTRDVDDDGIEATDEGSKQSQRTQSIVPISWYERQIDTLIPSKAHSLTRRYAHPKIRAVVDAAVRLWLSGEKVLIFCFFRETAKALNAHLLREVDRTTTAVAAKKLGMDPTKDAAKAREWLDRISRRLGDEDSPFGAAIHKHLMAPFDSGQFEALRDRSDELVGLLGAYVRSPSFVARYFPIEEPGVRRALDAGRTTGRVVREGVDVLSAALTTQADGSGVTLLGRVDEFLRFAKELAQRSNGFAAVDDEDAAPDPLSEYLKAIAVYVRPRGSVDAIDTDLLRESRQGSFRVLPTVRMVYGDTRQETRERLMLAFNSPLFPEILVSSAVLGEGVDLHRFCRYMIHHDLCWNPSTIEQRTGRLDRIRCKAEVTRHPIEIFEPYLAGSADERMFRVVRDRERWFQIVMGQKFEFDEKTAEEAAARVMLPESLASELVFDLTRYRPES